MNTRIDSVHTEFWTFLDGVIESTARELFADYGVQLSSSPSAPGTERAEYAAFIGYTGEQVRGHVGIATSSALVCRTHPSGSSGNALTDRHKIDWIGELANQLLGRAKNKLLARGIYVHMSTPAAIAGSELRGTPTPGASSRAYQFNSDFGAVHITAEALIEMDELPADGVECATEGELIEF